MGKIRLLSEEVISKIAAGEIIEKPSYVVKELIENSLDAKATSIKIELREFGFAQIAIFDNGVGMSKKDLMIAWKSHTTSKISQEQDLLALLTLGFRGEALSTIAAVSDLTIQSKTRNEKKGTKISISSFKLKKISSIGMDTGTKVVVNNLFSKVPARKKFLKNKRSEYSQILSVIQTFVLSHPHVSFTLTHNGKQVFRFNKNHTLKDRIQKLFGEVVVENLIPIRLEESYIKYHGYLSRPQVSFSNKSKVYIFVNGRSVKSDIHFAAIKDAYTHLLEPNYYPFIILFVTIPAETLDINVHPKKDLVKFVHQEDVYSLTFKGIDETLKNNNLTFFNLSWKNKVSRSVMAKTISASIEEDTLTLGKIEKSKRVLQVLERYIVAETQNGIILIDQHAAHEAILYRKYCEEFIKQKKQLVAKPLAKSQLLNLTFSENEILKQYFDIFKNLGFELEEFGDNVVRINALPSILEDINSSIFISEILENLKDGTVLPQLDSQTKRVLAFLACKSAIKSGQKLQTKQIKKLIKMLSRLDYLYTCPHGRPVKIEITKGQLDRLFKRS